MKTDFLRTLAGALVALASLAGSAMAQDVHLASTTDMNNIYARLAELESRVAAGNIANNGGGDYDDGCYDCCKAGFIGGGEILWLKAFESDGDYGDFNYDEAFRFWIGYQGASGLGVRFRYFDFEIENDVDEFIDVTHTDLEVFDSIALGCHWDLLIGGGIRYLDYFENADANTQALTGVGPVVTAELYRHICERAALYAIVRESIIVGDGINADIDQEDGTTNIGEIQLGLQANRELASGALLFGRVGWEAQSYHDLVDGDELTTLMGGALSGGIMR